MKILHIINTLEHGGAQSVLLQLLEGWDDGKDSQMVVTLKGRNQLSARLEALNVPVINIPFQNFIRLIKTIRKYRPDVIQTWLYHSSLAGSVIQLFNRHIPVVWGIHHTLFGLNILKPFTAFIVRILSLLSNVSPNRIVYCSESACQTHLALGYSREKAIVIPNGVNTKRFRPDPLAIGLIKRELGLEEPISLIGMFARFHPQKDFYTLIHAAKLLIQHDSRVHFVLAGDKIDSSNPELTRLIKNENLQAHFHLLGSRNDMPGLINAMKIVTLTSSDGEAMPQILAEAMACGIPCVATDVGDVEKLIADTGVVIEPRNAMGLADAWAKILTLPDIEYNQLRLKARQRIQEFYGSQTMVERYRKLYRSVIYGENKERN